MKIETPCSTDIKPVVGADLLLAVPEFLPEPRPFRVPEIGRAHV
jgi:hypothetical protein